MNCTFGNRRRISNPITFLFFHAPTHLPFSHHEPIHRTHLSHLDHCVCACVTERPPQATDTALEEDASSTDVAETQAGKAESPAVEDNGGALLVTTGSALELTPITTTEVAPTETTTTGHTQTTTTMTPTTTMTTLLTPTSTGSPAVVWTTSATGQVTSTVVPAAVDNVHTLLIHFTLN